MFLCRVAPEGVLAAGPSLDALRVLYSDPFESPLAEWELGRDVDLRGANLLAPVRPGKIVGIGRNYADHARELDNPVPTEPVIFLKSPGSVVGPGAPIVLPPESERVEFEGEIALVLRTRLGRATPEEAIAAVLGVTAACDVTARDLQRRDPTFARAKSFDTFCPLGPAIRLDAPLDDLAVRTRVDGELRQEGHVRDLLFGFAELLSYVSRMMTLEAGDVVLTGTPAGVGPLADGDEIAVEVDGLPPLVNSVEAWRGER